MESTPFLSFSQSSQPGSQPPSPQSSGQPSPQQPGQPRTGLPLASLVPAPRNGQPLPPDAGIDADPALAPVAKSRLDRRLWSRGYFPEPLIQELAYDQLDRLLLWCTAKRASDVVFCPGDPCWMQVDGVWHPCTEAALTAGDTQRVVNATSGQSNSASRVLTGKPMDYAFSLRMPGRARSQRLRLRLNATNTAKGIYVVARILPTDIPTLADMDLDGDLARHLFPASGLVAVSGVMGSGKSTLLAAVMHQALTGGLGRQVLTLEDPVEFDFAQLGHTLRQAPVAQSALGVDVEDWPSGVRSMTRRKGEIVMLGECRDEETVSAMLSVVEQGVTAYTTVHARDVPQTVTRLVNAVREERRSSTACVLASSLRLLVHQRLVPCLRTPEEARAGKPRRLALREHLALDESARRLLYRTPPGDMVPVLRRLVAAQGRSLAQDALEKLRQGRIDEATYEEVLAEQEAAGKDAGRDAGTGRLWQAGCSELPSSPLPLFPAPRRRHADSPGHQACPDSPDHAGRPAQAPASCALPSVSQPVVPAPAQDTAPRAPESLPGQHAQSGQPAAGGGPASSADEAGWARIHRAMYGRDAVRRER